MNSDDSANDSDDNFDAGQIAGLVAGIAFLVFLLYVLFMNQLRYWFCRDRYIPSSIPHSTPEQHHLQRLRQRELQRRSNLSRFSLISSSRLAAPPRDQQKEAEEYRKKLEELYEEHAMRIKLSESNIIQDEDDTMEEQAKPKQLPDDANADDGDIELQPQKLSAMSVPVSSQYIEITRNNETTTYDGICAICLDTYAAEDVLIVSSQQCTHGFHEDCITDYLVLHHLDHRDEEHGKEAPCPCCRRKFV
eukprot:CAMPEP_0198133986 /NCGR_PEP_ID=MMETSP1442-20131203/59847_1 /TAXON_ID= /ORGANISM="Craspedostauros australis, Strain CCMP3328" /LENGTH=247 /DNA_ID=CAMNT_0043795121 /DNA_START=264 /DNA_END=1007 /DNA_ORIENTATION=+